MPKRANRFGPSRRAPASARSRCAPSTGRGCTPTPTASWATSAGRGLAPRQALTASRLGRKFLVRDGEPEFARRLAVAFRDHNAEAGAHWNATIDRRRPRADPHPGGRESVQRGVRPPPADDRELSGFIARNTRARTTAVAGYDLTFSPVKSVSALWAIAPLPVAEQIEAAHDAAVADVLEWLQDSAAFTRTGANGVAQVDTEGLIAAAFTHRDSRAGDPDLHTHVAVSNKVSHVDANGVRRWLALDGQPLHRVTVAASELYNTRLEAHMIASLGVRFVEQARGRGKRPVREIDGMSDELMSRWSSRRAAIEARTAELAKQFQAAHGREPTNVEIIALAQQATLESREAKHEPRSLAEQRHTWRTQAVEVLGRRGLNQMLADTLAGPDRTQSAPDDRCAMGRGACWRTDRHRQRGALNLAAPPRARRSAAPGPRARPGARWRTGRTAHRHRTGGGVFGAARPRRRCRVWVSLSHCVAATAPASTAATASRSTPARRRWPPSGASWPRSDREDGRRASAGDVELALADSAARGRTLNPGQAALVSEMATCGRRVALALAPAGTGKTTAMAALAHAWRSSGGHVIGLAPTADAAIVLGEDLGATTDTLDKYVWSADPTKAATRRVRSGSSRSAPTR